jgi:MFS family permease
MHVDVERMPAGLDIPVHVADRSAPSGVSAGRARGAVAWLESHALFIAGVAAVVVLSLAGIPAHLSQDGWLALVAGRIIAAHGIPHHDYLTVMAHGVRWTDQQWLAQLAIYELYRIGGLALFAACYVALTGAALAAAIAAARNLGGRDRHVTAMLPVGAFFYLATAVSIRTQGFAYPLFVAVLWLLAAEARRPTRRRVYLVFPLLVVWANLHGSVTLGVALAAIYGGLELVRGVRRSGLRGLAHRRGLAFAFGAPLCLLATPYGASIVGYYRVTLLNPEFGKLITEWQPVTAYTILAVPFLLLALGAIYAIGRSGSRTPAFDQLALALLALGGIFAVRNITWFGLAAVILLPATLGTVLRDKPAAPRRRRLNVAIASSSVVLVLVAVVVTFARPAPWFQRTYPKRAVATIAGILGRDPDAKIFADVRFADWLVWNDPRIAGHIAYDTSFENLTAAQLASLTTLGQAIVPGVHDPVAPYSVLMLVPSNKLDDRALLARPGVRVILRSKRVIIATKPAT